jgi:hypothetical protein
MPDGGTERTRSDRRSLTAVSIVIVYLWRADDPSICSAVVDARQGLPAGAVAMSGARWAWRSACERRQELVEEATDVRLRGAGDDPVVLIGLRAATVHLTAQVGKLLGR